MAVGCRLSAIGCLSLLACLPLGGCGSAPGATSASDSTEVQSLVGPTMGTRYSVRYWTENCDAGPPDFQAWVDARLAEINRRMSTYDPESELSRFNSSTSDDWFEVSSETAAVVAFALEIAEDSGGAFDPTVGPVVNLWGFGPDGRRKAPPSDEEVAAALALVGYQKVEARLNPPALRKTEPGVYVDLSAVAKGYASDSVAELLTENGAAGCMVEIGGEIATRGTKPPSAEQPGGEPWRIGVEKPESGGQALQEIIEVSGGALATSGDYRNYFQTKGARYSHTIDPTTGRPVTHPTAAVSVQAETCMKADALATTLLVLGAERGYDWAQERGVAALFVVRSEEGFTERKTTDWESIEKDDSD